MSMLDLNAKAIINSQLKDKEGKSVSDIPIKITQMSYHNGLMSETDIVTDANGSFSCKVSIKCLYAYNHWITISAQIGERTVKRHCGRALQPGQRERHIEESLIYGMTLNLEFSVP